MKCLGLISADGLDRAAHCGSRITEEMQHRLGKQAHANLISLNLHTAEFAEYTRKNNWSQLAIKLGEVADWMRSVGADMVVPCSANLHLAAESLSPKLPILHIADPTAAALRRARVKRIGLVGATNEHEEQYWRRRLARAGFRDVFTPVVKDREHLAMIVSGELRLGLVRETSRSAILRIIYSLRRETGVRALIYCAPELSLVSPEEDSVLPVFDATELHVLAAVDWALAIEESKCLPP
jgi:aspartate racemase